MDDEQYDDHIWLVVRGEAWAIERVVGKTLIYLWRGYHPNIERTIISIAGLDIERYTQLARRMLDE